MEFLGGVEPFSTVVAALLQVIQKRRMWCLRCAGNSRASNMIWIRLTAVMEAGCGACYAQFKACREGSYTRAINFRVRAVDVRTTEGAHLQDLHSGLEIAMNRMGWSFFRLDKSLRD